MLAPIAPVFVDITGYGGDVWKKSRPVSGQSKHVTIYLATDKADKRTSSAQKMDENGMEKVVLSITHSVYTL